MHGSIRIQNVLHCYVRVASLGAFEFQWNVAYCCCCCRGMNQTRCLVQLSGSEAYSLVGVRSILVKCYCIMGSGVGSVVERRTRDENVSVSIPGMSDGRIFFSRSTFCANSYFGIRSTLVLPQ